MRRLFQVTTPGIGTKLTAGFGILVGLTLLVVALAFVAGRDATRDIEVSEAVRAPASLASAQAQEALLRMQLHLRGYLMLSDPEDVAEYQVARQAFEKALASLQGFTAAADDEERSRVQALAAGYLRWKRLPPRLFELHEDTLRNRPALRLARIDVQARRVRALAEVEAMIELQKARAASEVNRESLMAMLTFESSFDALATNVMAFGASGESNFKLTYSPQLVANAAVWDALNARRGWMTPRQREHLDNIAEARLELTELALQIRAILDGDHGYEDLYWVSYADTHHSRNLTRDGRLSGVVFDSTRPPGESSAVYVTGTAREVPVDELAEHLPTAFDPDGRGGRRFSAEELSEDDGLRLWVLRVEGWEVHVRAGHPTLGTGRDRRVAVDPRPGRVA